MFECLTEQRNGTVLDMKYSHTPEKETRKRRKVLAAQLEHAEAITCYPFLVQVGYFLGIVQTNFLLKTSEKFKNRIKK